MKRVKPYSLTVMVKASLKSRGNTTPHFVSPSDIILVESWVDQHRCGGQLTVGSPWSWGKSGTEKYQMLVRVGRGIFKVSPCSCKEALAEIGGAWREPLPTASDRETRECNYVKSMTGWGPQTWTAAALRAWDVWVLHQVWVERVSSPVKFLLSWAKPCNCL